MYLLVNKGHGTLASYNLPNLGRLLSPREYSRASDTARSGMVWAADNDAYLAWDEPRYWKMLEAISGLEGCKFVTAPDKVGDAAHTDVLYRPWSDILRSRGLPVAYVLQDGATAIPETAAAVFVGGTSQYKMSHEARDLVDEAKARGLWVHMGRVNTWRRLEYAKSIGCHSIDGTQLSMFTDTYLERWSELAAAPAQGAL